MIGFFRVFAAFVLLPLQLSAEIVRFAVTTSFDNSGLAAVLIPHAEKALGFDIRLIVVGTGQALRLGATGDVDAVMVHSRAAEEDFIANGYGEYRREIMYNDFVLVGPRDDPAGIAKATDVRSALRKIAQTSSTFISRGDDGGTHKREKMLWREAQNGRWYREIGAGMGAALNMAAALDAYTLSDRASWLKFKNKRNLSLLYSGDLELFNQYAYLPISFAHHPHVNSKATKALEDWLTGPDAKALIDGYKLDGQKMFVFNAKSGPQ